VNPKITEITAHSFLVIFDSLTACSTRKTHHDIVNRTLLVTKPSEPEAQPEQNKSLIIKKKKEEEKKKVVYNIIFK
jgi:hypothetical protein